MTGGETGSAPVLDPALIEASTPADCLTLLGSSRDGLGSEDAARRLEAWGRNEVRTANGPRFLRLLFSNFTNLLALLLWIAAFLAFVGRLPELGFAILAVVLINGVFSVVQEHRASRLVESLQRQARVIARVRREGFVSSVDSVLLVPGDVVLLGEGDRVPADCRLLQGADLRTDESALTGESVPVSKSEAGVAATSGGASGPNLLHSGTLVVHGSGEALVWATGERSQFGAITELAASLSEAAGPLRREIEGLARITAVFAVVAGLVVWALSTVVIGRQFNEGFVFAVGVIVALVPEGLLPTLSLSLALGVQRMSQRHVLVRRLSAVEALGATQVICTDKTGTLTLNRMRVELLWLDGREYRPKSVGSRLQLEAEAPDGDATAARRLVQAAMLASDVGIAEAGDSPARLSGDPTEVAIVALGLELGLELKQGRLAEVPFDSFRRMMSTLDDEGGRRMLHSKGAPDAILERCLLDADGSPLGREARERVLASADAYAARGMRMLAAAKRELAAGEEAEACESDMQFLGLIALMDPVRPEATDAVARCRAAGIRVLVITGDHPATAAEIARQTGIVSAEPHVVTGEEIESMTPAALRSSLAREVVFARTTPVQKLAIVSELQAMGNVVAVIGDGVNDAPSLRKADVGVAMGRGGTDVAREAADIVLMDDNFATIVEAIEEGRSVFQNIRKFVTYVFTSNVAELVPFAAFVLTGIPLPLKVLQVLAVDLGTDLLPALALGAEPPEAGVLGRPPRARDAPILDRRTLARTFLLLGPVEAVLGLAGFFFVYLSHGWQPGEAFDPALYALATTMTFSAIVAGQVGNAFACRSAETPALGLPPASNRLLLVALLVEAGAVLALVYLPPLRSVFDFAGPGAREWLLLLFLLPLLPLADSAEKLLRAWLRNRRTSP